MSADVCFLTGSEVTVPSLMPPPGGQNWSETAETTAMWCIDLGGKMGSESATDEWRRGFALGWAAKLEFLSQCSFSAEQQGRETQRGGERETREREENGLNDNESEERKGRGDVEWLLEIGDGGTEEMVKRKRIDPDGILEIHIVTSPSTESCELDGGENRLCVTWSQQTFFTTADCQICSANLESLQKRAQLQKSHILVFFFGLPSETFGYKTHRIHPTMHVVNDRFQTLTKTDELKTDDHHFKTGTYRLPCILPEVSLSLRAEGPTRM